MISSIQQAASSIQTALRNWEGSLSSFNQSAGALGARAVQATAPGSPDGGVGVRNPTPEEAREPEEQGSRDLREDPTDLAIDTIETKMAVGANLAVIKSADSMLGTLLDVVG